MRDKVEQLQADIEAGVAELIEGEDWQRWLRVAARFPRYSFRNTLLIQLQRPDASVVMGYRAWQALGHQVRKGEQSISILAPCTYKTPKDSNDNEDESRPSEKVSSRRVLRGFRIAHVFDPPKPTGTPFGPPTGPPSSTGKPPPASGTPSPTRSCWKASHSPGRPSLAEPTAPPTSPPEQSPSPTTSPPPRPPRPSPTTR
jgi:hypothetical protein